MGGSGWLPDESWYICIRHLTPVEARKLLDRSPFQRRLSKRRAILHISERSATLIGCRLTSKQPSVETYIRPTAHGRLTWTGLFLLSRPISTKPDLQGFYPKAWAL